MITQLQKQYIQKSRIFLYPLLGIKRGSSTTPVQTYLVWEDEYDVNDYKFIAVYHMRDDAEFRDFEEKRLLGNPLFTGEFHELEDGNAAYVFDMKSYQKEFKLIVHGKYSMLSTEFKNTILKFFKSHQSHHAAIKSYLMPDKFMADYAKLLNVSESLLKEVGELCSLPDLDLEKLKVKKKVLTFDSVNNL